VVTSVVAEKLPDPPAAAAAATTAAATTPRAAATDGGRRRQLVGHGQRYQRCDGQQGHAAHDPGIRAGPGRPGVAELVVRLVAEPDVQPVRSRPVRTHVQGARPESVLASGLGAEFGVLQRSEGKVHCRFKPPRRVTVNCTP